MSHATPRYVAVTALVLLSLLGASAVAQEAGDGRRRVPPRDGGGGSTGGGGTGGGGRAQPREPGGDGGGRTGTAQPRGEGQGRPSGPTARGPERRGGGAGSRIGVRPGQLVFVGGYFYDPFYGPYPWWGRTRYPHWYVPIYDARAEIRTLVSPRDAAVYVDGFYAGTADDFDGIFQSLPLPPGGHQISFYLEGFRTARFNVYLRPGSTMKLRHEMERLPRDARPEPPPAVPPVPEPPEGSFRPPRTPLPAPSTASAPPPAAPEGEPRMGRIDLHVQPGSATVSIDGEKWISSDEGHYVLQLPVGRHTVEVFEERFRRFIVEIEIRDGETTPLDVSLLRH
jgi:hypothetical protein